MRVMTYNIEDGGGERASLIAEAIASANPDVVLLNEADDERIVAALAQQLHYASIWARGSGDKHIALLTRLPIGEWRSYNRRPFTQAILHVKLKVVSEQLSVNSEQPSASNLQSLILKRRFAVSNIQPPITNDQLPITHIQLFAVHLLPYFMLLPYEFARWRTVRALLQLVKREAHGPHLILGDCNAVMRGERADTTIFPQRIQRRLWLQGRWLPRFALGQITRAGYTDCFRHLHPHAAGLTWMPQAPSARLDYIFADARMAQHLQRCEVITTPPAERASDHFPLVADFN
jgi:endonuclease/exonuclease/phosphatase family metal-dependent hydrolase